MEEFRRMNDRPQRPKFYLHRSRRFWFGIVSGLFLAACWFRSLESLRGLSYREFHPLDLYIADEQTRSLAILNGTLQFRHFKAFQDIGGGTPRRFEITTWRLISEPEEPLWLQQTYGRWLPSWGQTDAASEFGVNDWRLVIPLWPIPIAWTGLWIALAIRGNRKKEAYFRQVTNSSAESHLSREA